MPDPNSSVPPPLSTPFSTTPPDPSLSAPVPNPPPVVPPQPIAPDPIPSPTPPAPDPLTPQPYKPLTSYAQPPEPVSTAPTPLPSKKIPKLFLLIPIILAVVILLLLLGRALWSRIGPKSPVTLTYWGITEPTEAISAIINEYQSSHPGVTINYQPQSLTDYRERLQNQLAGGHGPDIFRFHNTWVPMFRNYLSPLPSQIMSEDAFAATFYPVAQKDLLANGQFIGLPLTMDTLLLYVNQDLLASSGKSPPRSWEELLQTAQELKAGGVPAVALGNTSNIDHWPEILALLMMQNGTDMTHPGSTIGSDGKNLGEDALRFYTLFTKDYQIWDDTLPNSTQAFATGRLALYIGPSFHASEFNQNPGLHYTTLTTPRLADVEAYYATYWAAGVSEKSQHQAEAWEFLNFLTQKENQLKIYQAQVQENTVGEPPSRVDIASDLSGVEIVSTVYASAPKAISWYVADGTQDGNSGINSRLKAVFTPVVDQINQHVKPEEAILSLDQGVSQLLSQYGIR